MLYTYPVCFIKHKSYCLIDYPDFDAAPTRSDAIEEATVLSHSLLKNRLLQMKNSGISFPKATNYNDVDPETIAQKHGVSPDSVFINTVDVRIPKYSRSKSTGKIAD